jgi:hypothetical protein
MSDIVERLRNWRSVHLARLHLLMEEAAAEIERLQITDAEREAVSWCVEMAMTSATDCEDEIATLRGLLERTRG